MFQVFVKLDVLNIQLLWMIIHVAVKVNVKDVKSCQQDVLNV